jgi:hypothetical protein
MPSGIARNFQVQVRPCGAETIAPVSRERAMICELSSSRSVGERFSESTAQGLACEHWCRSVEARQASVSMIARPTPPEDRTILRWKIGSRNVIDGT